MSRGTNQTSFLSFNVRLFENAYSIGRIYESPFRDSKFNFEI